MCMMTRRRKSWQCLRRRSEKSFTLIEVVIAMSLMAFLIIEVASVQGNAVIFNAYGRNVTQATWLAQRILAQVEYNWTSKPFTELEQQITDKPFAEFPEYKWSLDIKEWKFPFTKILTGGLGGGGEEGEEEKQDDGMTAMIESVTDQVFGDEPIFMTARAEVSWSDGARRDSTSLTYLLTNQAKLDEALIALKPVWDKLTKPKKKKKKTKNKKSAKKKGEIDPDAPPPEGFDDGD